MRTLLLLAIGVVLVLVVGSLFYPSTDDDTGTQPSPHSLQTDPPD